MADKTKPSTARGRQKRRAAGDGKNDEGGKQKRRMKESKDAARPR